MDILKRPNHTIEHLTQLYNNRVVKSINPATCWGWTGNLSDDGYGRFAEGNYKAHRFSWEINRGPIPFDKHLVHICDNKECSNPNHLFLKNKFKKNKE